MPNDVELLRRFDRAGRQVAAGIITPAEFGTSVLLFLADNHSADVALAPELVAALPEAARQHLRAALALALDPGFRSPTWPVVGRPWETAEVVTARVKAWASALAEYLGDESPTG